jgi:acyl-CoA thioesterase-1
VTSKLQARGIKVILPDNLSACASSSSRDPDGVHFNTQGHAAIAAGLLPRVVAAAEK